MTDEIYFTNIQKQKDCWETRYTEQVNDMSQAIESIDQCRKELLEEFKAVRAQTKKLAAPLQPEDCVVQSMDDTSPAKWHLAHVTWFFERVILQQFSPNYRPFNEKYYYIFNSYYNSLGQQADRPLRGTLSRPTVPEIMEYRAAIDERVEKFIATVAEKSWNEIYSLFKIGFNHEQQHQELLLSDIKHVFASNPLQPAYLEPVASTSNDKTPFLRNHYLTFKGGLVEVGADNADSSGAKFTYDNESPRHKVYLEDFKLLPRLVTCGEFLEFINDGGYDNPSLWLADAWGRVPSKIWRHPMYWEKTESGWTINTLSGTRPLNLAEPVCHVSYYESWAFARWAGKRLPTEMEWEFAAETLDEIQRDGNFVEKSILHPTADNPVCGKNDMSLSQMFGDVWEWTASSYLAYPGYKQEAGPLGEYNGKFMSDQMVLRGGSCLTPKSHVRTTYRSFFQCDKRWQMTGIRLADNV